jgi:hypothetical protein
MQPPRHDPGMARAPDRRHLERTIGLPNAYPARVLEHELPTQAQAAKCLERRRSGSKPNAAGPPSKVTYAEVATPNHFVLDPGWKVFRQTAPVIKLPAGGITGAAEVPYPVHVWALAVGGRVFWRGIEMRMIEGVIPPPFGDDLRRLRGGRWGLPGTRARRRRFRGVMLPSRSASPRAVGRGRGIRIVDLSRRSAEARGRAD